jgi:hypothetical protein
MKTVGGRIRELVVLMTHTKLNAIHWLQSYIIMKPWNYIAFFAVTSNVFSVTWQLHQG